MTEAGVAELRKPIILSVLLVFGSWFGDPRAAAQLPDTIIRIDGEPLPSPAALPYFNARQCAEPDTTLYDLQIAQGGSPAPQVYLWAGQQNAGCERAENRIDPLALCRQIEGNPRNVAADGAVTNLSLLDLVDTGIVDCENRALEGLPFSIYAFRDADPEGRDIDPSDYGVASFVVDVTPPQALELTSSAEQTGPAFSISWLTPIDASSIFQYRVYASATDDPEAARTAGAVAIAAQYARSATVEATSLGLMLGEEVYLYVSAVDHAAVPVGDGNEGPLSTATTGIAGTPPDGCNENDGGCPDGGLDAGVDGGDTPSGGGASSGCAVAQRSPVPPAAWLVALLLLLAWARRRRGCHCSAD